MRIETKLKRRILLTSLCASILICFAFAAARAPFYVRAQRGVTAPAKEKPKEKPAAQEASPTPAAKPTTSQSVSNSNAALELRRSIDREIDESEFAKARWGVFVMSLRDNRVLYARQADKAFTPASNMKVYTTAAALDLLGADYRWRTSVYAQSEPDASGTIRGDLILYGRGAPDLVSHPKKETDASLARLADDLYKRGVRRVRGSIVGDESYFKGDPLGSGWSWNDIQWYFGAEVSALSINDNEVMLTVTPGAKVGERANIKINASGDALHITNDTNTAERGTVTSIGITRGLSDNELRVWGDFPVSGRGINARLSVHQPALWAARLFRDALRARGITVEGDVRASDSRLPEKDRFDPARAVELAFISSKTLGEIVRPTNKESINLYAELILRTLGKERGATAPDPDEKRMRLRGDDQAGAAVMRKWLQETIGVQTDSLALHDGSGLSRLDLITPEATGRLLAAMTKSPASQIFHDSLPIAGRDGTLEYRLRKVTVANRLYAKTGTITYVGSLSGYVMTADEEPLVFSIICNDETARQSSTHTIDAIATLLAEYTERQK